MLQYRYEYLDTTILTILTILQLGKKLKTTKEKNDLTEVKDELYKLKSLLIKQEILLKEILLKIK